MITLENVFLAISITITCALPWFLYCNHRTHRQRLYILFLISQKSRRMIDEEFKMWGEGYNHLENISYGYHLFTLCSFQNPYKLYHSEIQELLEQDNATAKP